MKPTTLLAELWADGTTITLAPDGVNLAAPPNRLTPEQRQIIKANKPALIEFLLQTSAITDAVIAAAMRVCDRHGDNAAARQQMLQDVQAVPPHQQQDLLDHFQNKPVTNREGS